MIAEESETGSDEVCGKARPLFELLLRNPNFFIVDVDVLEVVGFAPADEDASELELTENIGRPSNDLLFDFRDAREGTTDTLEGGKYQYPRWLWIDSIGTEVVWYIAGSSCSSFSALSSSRSSTWDSGSGSSSGSGGGVLGRSLLLLVCDARLGKTSGDGERVRAGVLRLVTDYMH
jgi:hypothetical protein